MGRLLTRFSIFINTILSYYPYSQKKVHLEIRYVAAHLGDCGIACVAMLASHSSVDELLKKYKHPPFYIDPVGWYHSGLVQILHDLNYSSQAQSGLTIWQLRTYLEQGKVIIVSLKVPHPNDLSVYPLKTYISNNQTAKTLGHLCLLTGYDANGFYLHDPRNLKGYAENIFVPYRTFARIFTGNGIVIN